MPELHVELLGPPRVSVDGTALEVDTRKALALLARLVVEGDQRRDTLAAFLWPSSDESHARATLRRTLSALRKGLDGHWVEADRDEVRLDRAATDADVLRSTELEARVDAHDHPDRVACGDCRAALEEAVGLHRGRFMEGFHLRDCAPFEDWRSAEAERQGRRLRRLLDRLIEIDVAQEAFTSAVTHVHRRLELDPLHEPSHRRLMLLHAWLGDRAAAVRQYRECARVLDEELGVSPLERTETVHELIVDGRAPDPPGAEPSTPPAPLLGTDSADTPLVGRAAELEQLLGAHAAAARATQVVWVEGEAGVGKSTLVREFVARARADGARVAAISAYEEEQQVAFAVVADVLRSIAAAADLDDVPERWLEEAARVTPELLEHRPDLAPSRPRDTPEQRRRLLEAVRQVVTGALPGPAPGVLVVDDVHWADDASLDALFYLARRTVRSPVCLVLVARPGLLDDDQQLPHVQHGTEDPPVVTHLRLDRFGADRVRELADAMDVEANEADVERLVRESEGLPLLAVEYLALLATEGEAEDWQVADDIRAVFSQQWDRLSDAAEQLATAAAVIGRSFRLDLLLEASGRDIEEAVPALDELTGSGLLHELEPGPDPVYGFRHRMLRDVVDERLGAARRRLLHARTATALQHRRATAADGNGERPSAGLVARHLRAAGRSGEAAVAHATAAEEAMELSAHAEATAHLRSAIELGHPDQGALHRKLGDLLTRRGHYGEALQAYARASEQADGTALARLERRIASVHERRGDWTAAAEHVDAGLAALPSGEAPVARARLLTAQAHVAHRRGDDAAARGGADAALEVAAETGDARSRAQARNLLGMLARTGGDHDRAVAHLEEGLAAAVELDDPTTRIAVLNNLALAHVERGDRAAGLELAKTALGLCRRYGDRHREAALCNNLADLLYEAGQRKEALGYVREAVSLFAQVGEPERHEPEIWMLVDW